MVMKVWLLEPTSGDRLPLSAGKIVIGRSGIFPCMTSLWFWNVLVKRLIRSAAITAQRVSRRQIELDVNLDQEVVTVAVVPILLILIASVRGTDHTSAQLGMNAGALQRLGSNTLTPLLPVC